MILIIFKTRILEKMMILIPKMVTVEKQNKEREQEKM
jgi:hypothetical protein